VRLRKILFIFGTRPEAIKLCPVIRYFREHADGLEPRICVTAQHRAMLDQGARRVRHRAASRSERHAGRADAGGRDQPDSGSPRTGDFERQPDLILVQGDTATTLCGALAGFYARVPVGHIEAGLRTGDLAQPFPEEMNR